MCIIISTFHFFFAARALSVKKQHILFLQFSMLRPSSVGNQVSYFQKKNPQIITHNSFFFSALKKSSLLQIINCEEHKC